MFLFAYIIGCHLHMRRNFMKLNRGMLTLLSLYFSCSVQTSAYAAQKIKGLGTAVGAAAGAVIGAQVGSGDTKIITSAIGAVAGAVIGNEVEKLLDNSDRVAFFEAQASAMSGSVDELHRWDGSLRGSRTGASGEITILREGQHRLSQLLCREYQSVIHVGVQQEVNIGVACRDSNGNWYEESTQQVSFKFNIYESKLPRLADSNSFERFVTNIKFSCLSKVRRGEGNMSHILGAQYGSYSKISEVENLVFNSERDCIDMIDGSVMFGHIIFMCARAQDSGGKGIYFSTPEQKLRFEQAGELQGQLTFLYSEDCAYALSTARLISTGDIILCATNEYEGSWHQYYIYRITPDFEVKKASGKFYNNSAQCNREAFRDYK